MQTSLFVSYCHNDHHVDPSRTKVLLDSIARASGHTIRIVHDSADPQAEIGGSLPEYMQIIESCDAVVILLTPEYRRRIVSRDGSGVYREYQKILDRLWASEHARTYGKEFIIFPILFSGTFDESCPNEIKHLIGKDISWLHVSDNNKVKRVQPKILGKLKELCSELVGRMNAVRTTKGQQYLTKQEDIFREFLFGQTKSGWGDPANRDFYEPAFVKTWTFQRVRNGHVKFVVGRKGAGKSTITHALAVLGEPVPTVALRVEFEKLPLSLVYNLLRIDNSIEPPLDQKVTTFDIAYERFKENRAVESDLHYAVSPIMGYQMLWDVFLHIFFVWKMSQSKSGARYKRLINEFLGQRLRSVKLEDENLLIGTSVLFVRAFEKLVEFVDKSITVAESGGSYVNLVAHMNLTAFREYAFGVKGWEKIEESICQLRQRQERVLITVDGFDSMVGYFVRSAEHMGSAARFERELLMGLSQLVLNNDALGYRNSCLYDRSTFCIAIPFDRFLDIRSHDRDRYLYRQRFASLRWSGLELSALARKRLALLHSVEDKKGPNLRERLESVMRLGYPELPDELVFKFGSAIYHMPLFIYLLRHTLWRPRDILFYYSVLLAASETNRKSKQIIETSFVRQVIAGATRFVVNDEFIDEFKGSFRNLDYVLSRFQQAPQYLSWVQLKELIDHVKFDVDFYEGTATNLYWKIERLHEMGILGVSLDRKTADQYSSFKHSFSFIDGELLQTRIARDKYEELTYIVHPVFCEHLNIDTSSNPELVLPLEWSDLKKIEDIQRAMPM